MGVSWFSTQCHSCKGAVEKLCSRICPGDLLFWDNGGLKLRDAAECWDCAACVKACPAEALALEMPPALGGGTARLFGKSTRYETRWRLVYDGGEEQYITIARRDFDAELPEKMVQQG